MDRRRLLTTLRDELLRLSAETSAFISEAAVEWQDEDGRTVLALKPSHPLRERAKANEQRFRLWSLAVASILRRRTVVRPQDFQELTKEFEPLVGLSVTGSPDQLKSDWKKEIKERIAELSRAMMELLDTAESAFDAAAEAPVRDYDTFVLHVHEDADGWHIEAKASGDVAQVVVPIPLTGEEVQQFVSRHGTPSMPDGWQDIEAFTAFGRALHQALFVDDVRALYNRARSAAAARGAGVRIVIIARAGLSAIPWELLHDGNHFLCLGTDTALLRAIDDGCAGVLGALPSPLRILLTISTPSSEPWLDVELESSNMEAAVAPLIMLDSVQLDIAANGTMNAVRLLLRAAADAQRPYQVWHFVGHGRYDHQGERAELIMTDDLGAARSVGRLEIAALFREHAPHLKMVVLNACKAGSRTEEAMSGAAAAFVEIGVPAVVAMQFSISDAAAIAFSAELYDSLADGAAIETAVTEARRAIFFQPNYLEWVTPILFTATSV